MGRRPGMVGDSCAAGRAPLSFFGDDGAEDPGGSDSAERARSAPQGLASPLADADSESREPSGLRDFVWSLVRSGLDGAAGAAFAGVISVVRPDSPVRLGTLEL